MTAKASAVQTAVNWRDLRDWVALMEERGELLVVDAEVDPHEELAGITYMLTQQKNEQALLFRNIKGDASGSRILSNMLGASKSRYALSVGLDPDLSTADTIAATRRVIRQKIAPRHVERSAAPVCEKLLTGAAASVKAFPMPKFWPGDGGPYFGTGSVTITKDPESGRLNAGVYRQQAHADGTLGLVMVPGRHGLRNCEAAWARGKPAEVVVAFGVEPALFIAATQSFDYGESEFDVAGGLMGRPVDVTKAELVDLPLPAHAEFVIEGLVHPDKSVMEGPLGEFNGYYSGQPSLKPVIEVKAIHHRSSPIFHAALMAVHPSCEIGAYHTIFKSARILDNLEAIGLPGVVNAYAHPGAASGYGLVVVSIRQMYPGHASQALALTAQCPAAAYCTKWIIVVDEDVDPCDFDQVMWALTTRTDPSADIDILRNTWSNRSDLSLEPDNRPYGSKALINACVPHKRMHAQSRTMLRKSVYDRVADRWAELGLPGEAPLFRHFHKE